MCCDFYEITVLMFVELQNSYDGDAELHNFFDLLLSYTTTEQQLKIPNLLTRQSGRVEQKLQKLVSVKMLGSYAQ